MDARGYAICSIQARHTPVCKHQFFRAVSEADVQAGVTMMPLRCAVDTQWIQYRIGCCAPHVVSR